jgi:hypothetical protein
MKTDYKVGDYIIFRDRNVIEIKTITANICHELRIHRKNIRLATPQEIIAAGFKPQVKTYELW